MSSRKMRSAVIVMVILLIAGIGGYFLIDRAMTAKEQEAAEEAASLKLMSFDSDTITRVDYTIPEGYFRMENTAGQWELVETDYPHSFTLNTDFLITSVIYMSDLEAVKKIDADPDALDKYGLADPIVLTCTGAGGSYTLNIGKLSSTKEYYYVQLPGDQTVYGIDTEYGDVLSGGTSYLKSAYMIDSYDVDIDSVLLERRGDTVFSLEKRDYNWQMLAPLHEASVNNASVSTMLTALTRVEVERFVTETEDPAELAQYGLDKPAFRLSVHDTLDKTTVIEVAEYKEGDTEVYIYFPSNGQVATLTASAAAFVQAPTASVLIEEILPISMEDTAELQAKVDDIAYTISIDHAALSYSFNDTPIDTGNSTIMSNLQYLFQASSQIAFEDMELDAAPETSEEAPVSFRYGLSDGTVRTLALYPKDDVTYYAFVDGTYTGMTVRRRALSGDTGVLHFYEKLTDAIEEAAGA